MRIAQISTGAGPVGPDAAGCVERSLWVLAHELNRRGHEVTTFGVKGSEVAGELVETLPGPAGAENSFDNRHSAEWVGLCEAIKQSGRFDIIHSHTRLWGLTLEALSNAPMVHTMHEQPEVDMARLWKMFPNARIIAVSQQQYSAFPGLNPIAVIRPGVDGNQFAYQSAPSDYLCYLGPLEHTKDSAEAIAMARAAGLRLVIGGSVSPHFTKTNQPLFDGKQVEIAGLTEPGARVRLLRNARAVICLARNGEAFGLATAESMMCGTPVVALRAGMVTDHVESGVTGFYPDEVGELPEALDKAVKLDRGRIREYAEEKFPVGPMIRHHEQVYQAICGVQAIA